MSETLAALTPAQSPELPRQGSLTPVSYGFQRDVPRDFFVREIAAGVGGDLICFVGIRLGSYPTAEPLTPYTVPAVSEGTKFYLSSHLATGPAQGGRFLEAQTLPWGALPESEVEPYWAICDAWRDIAERVGSRTVWAVQAKGVALPDVQAPLPLRGQLLELADWTQLPPELLGYLLGVSRRTIYNWTTGSTKKVRAAASERVARVHRVVSQLAQTRDPMFIRAWLMSDDPPIAKCLREERWAEVENYLEIALAPSSAPNTVLEGPSEQTESGDIRDAALKVFLSAPPFAPVARRPAWTPREVTGLGDLEDLE